MEDKKLKGIARKISEKLKLKKTVDERWKSFEQIIVSQIEYFRIFNFSEIIKIFLYSESIIKTGDTIVGEKIINNAYLIGVFRYDSDVFETESCDECDGSGGITCEYCGGSTEISCDYCDGNGYTETECSDCNGEGYDSEGHSCGTCSGHGQIDDECTVCNGSGNEPCERCMDGYNTCETCDGTGEIESDKNEYYFELFLVLDPNIGDELTMKLELKDPLDEDFELDNSIKLTSGRDYDEFDESVLSDRTYVYGAERLNDANESTQKIRTHRGGLDTIFEL